jgi:hypothetical protein
MVDQALVLSKLTAAEAAAIGMVLDSLPSEHSRRAYERALIDFFLWHRGAGRPQLSKAVVQRYAAELREAGMAPSSVNQRCQPSASSPRRPPTTARSTRRSRAASGL